MGAAPVVGGSRGSDYPPRGPSVHQGVLTAEVNGNPKVRVPLFRLGLAHAKIHAARHYVKISGIVLTLTGTAATALNATFGTTLFKAALELGTATTVLRF